MISNLGAASAEALRISVVIPVYNGAATIGRALDSVLAQHYSAHEVIVVDDGSQDQTAEVVRRYSGRVRYVRQDNAGPSAARNYGVKLATGDWIAFLDADDWYYPERLARHARMIEVDPDLDFLVGNFDYRDAEGQLLHDSMSATALGRELLERYGATGQGMIGQEALGRFIAEQFSDTRTLTLPRRIFLELGGFPEDMKICEDLTFLIRLCARSRRAGVVCAASAVYSVHDTGLIRSDRYRAQSETVRALRALSGEIGVAPDYIRSAWTDLVKKAYLNLAYFLAKSGHKAQAVKVLVCSFVFRPRLIDIKSLGSILKG